MIWILQQFEEGSPKGEPSFCPCEPSSLFLAPCSMGHHIGKPPHAPRPVGTLYWYHPPAHTHRALSGRHIDLLLTPTASYRWPTTPVVPCRGSILVPLPTPAVPCRGSISVPYIGPHALRPVGTQYRYHCPKPTVPCRGTISIAAILIPSISK
jgi:hypothetical protein